MCLIADMPCLGYLSEIRLMRIEAKNALLIEHVSCNIICAQRILIFNILHITLDIESRNRRVAEVEIG